MAQAKGILPRHGETDVMRDKRSNGYFLDVTLRQELDRAAAIAWLADLQRMVDELVAPAPGHPERRAGAVAIGLSRSFFFRSDGAVRFAEPFQIPGAFRHGLMAALPGDPLTGDLLLYGITPYEAKANAFISEIGAHSAVATVRLLRGYQRIDDTEPFGYRDGMRNVDPDDRTRVVHVDRDRQPEEPPGAEGGSYMAYLRIVQNVPGFNGLDPAQQDEVIGRTRTGRRLDLTDDALDPREEPATPPNGATPTAHVSKVGPRGARDDVQIFRRGLPFVETTPDGRVEVGLNFCSFQASPLQLDVVLNDWARNPLFTAQPNDPRGGGVDALFDPNRGLTTFRQSALCFVPPADPQRRHLGATLFDAPQGANRGRPQTARITILKRVVSDTQPDARFDRRGFIFRISDASTGQQVGGDLLTDSTGRAVSDPMPFGTYTVTEVGGGTVQGVTGTPTPQTVVLDGPGVPPVRFDNHVGQASIYGG